MATGTEEEENSSQSDANQSAAGSSKPTQEAVLAVRRADSAKKQDLVFEAWADGEGFVYFPHILEGIKKLEQFAESTTPVLNESDSPSYHRLDREEFRALMDRLMREWGKPLAYVAELLMLAAIEVQPQPDVPARQGSLEKAEEQAKQDQYIKELVRDHKVEQLFVHFNRSGSGQINFAELAQLLFQLRQDIPLQEARAQAVNTMLLCDTHSKRALGREEFARFLLKLGALLRMKAADLADTLFQVVEDGGSLPTPEDSATAFSMDSRDAIAQVYETLGDRKLHLLFELWDKDGDGLISFAELALGLRKFSTATEPVTETAADAAEALLVLDADSDQKLDRADFAHFVNLFCEACGSDFNTLSEFLILLAALEDNPSEELAFLLSEDKVDRAVAALGTTWAKDIDSASSATAPQGHASTDQAPGGTARATPPAGTPMELLRAAKEAVAAEACADAPGEGEASSHRLKN